MSTLDTYTEGFPHGTYKGFELACRGKAACPNNGTDQLTCMEAHGLYRGEYQFRRAIDEGLILTSRSWEADLAAFRASGAPTVAPAGPVAKGRKPRPKDTDVEQDDVAAGVRPPVNAAAMPGRDEIRAWARANGLEVKDRGVLPKRVVDAFMATIANPPIGGGHSVQAPQLVAVVDLEPDIVNAPVLEQQDLHQLIDVAQEKIAAASEEAAAESEARARNAAALVEQLRVQLAEASARADEAARRSHAAYLDQARAEIRTADILAEYAEFQAEWKGAWHRDSVEVVAVRMTAMLATIDQLTAQVADFDRMKARVAHLEQELKAADQLIGQLQSASSVAVAAGGRS